MELLVTISFEYKLCSAETELQQLDYLCDFQACSVMEPGVIHMFFLYDVKRLFDGDISEEGSDIICF